MEGDLRDAQLAEVVAEREGPPERKDVRPGRRRFEAGEAHGREMRVKRLRIRSDRAALTRTFVQQPRTCLSDLRRQPRACEAGFGRIPARAVPHRTSRKPRTPTS